MLGQIGDSNLRSLALLAGSELIKTNSSTKVVLLSQNVSSQLIQLIASDDHYESCAVLSILTTLAIDDEPFQREILDLGLLNQLTIAHQSEVYQSRFLDLCAVYVTTIDLVRVLMDSKILLEIINMIKSAHLSVRIRAAQLCAQFCHNQTIFDFLQSNGALEKLNSVNGSGHLKTQISEDIERILLKYNLPLKMATFNKLDYTDRLDSKLYYDCGPNQFDTLETLTDQPINKSSPIWLIKLFSDSETSPDIAETIITVTPSLEDAQSTKKGKKDKKKNKKRVTEVETPDLTKRTTLQPTMNPHMEENGLSRTGSKMGFDVSESHASLQSLKTDADYDVQLREFIESIEIVKDAQLHEQIESLAKTVSERFGGTVNDELVRLFNVDINSLKKTSNVLQLGQAKYGLMRERALLLKVLLDFHSIPTTLEQSQSGYGKVWNTVMINGQNFIVDLMHHPGRLLQSAQAFNYITY